MRVVSIISNYWQRSKKNISLNAKLFFWRCERRTLRRFLMHTVWLQLPFWMNHSLYSRGLWNKLVWTINVPKATSTEVSVYLHSSRWLATTSKFWNLSVHFSEVNVSAILCRDDLDIDSFGIPTTVWTRWPVWGHTGDNNKGGRFPWRCLADPLAQSRLCYCTGLVSFLISISLLFLPYFYLKVL